MSSPPALALPRTSHANPTVRSVGHGDKTEGPTAKALPLSMTRSPWPGGASADFGAQRELDEELGRHRDWLPRVAPRARRSPATCSRLPRSAEVQRSLAVACLWMPHSKHALR